MNNQKTDTTTDCGRTTCQASDTLRKAQPAYHVEETDRGVAINVALPGVKKEDLKVSTTGNILTLDAPRTDRVPDEWKAHRVYESPDHYALKVRLNRTLDPERVSASLEDGILRLEVAKREEARPRSISVH